MPLATSAQIRTRSVRGKPKTTPRSQNTKRFGTIDAIATIDFRRRTRGSQILLEIASTSKLEDHHQVTALRAHSEQANDLKQIKRCGKSEETHEQLRAYIGMMRLGKSLHQLHFCQKLLLVFVC
jgi:hypothetical protein